MRGKITVKDVAREAGVSATTVSYVLNETPGQTISEETRDRVLKAAEDLNYIPDNAARIMKNNASHCIGLVMNRSFQTARFSAIAAGVVETMEEMGYRIILCSGSGQDNGCTSYLDAYVQYRMDGLIFICQRNMGPSEEEKRRIEQDGIPVVVFDSLEQDVPYATVDFDYFQGAVSVTEQMIAQGQKNMVYFRPAYESRQEEQREAAFWQVMKDHPRIRGRVVRMEAYGSAAVRRQKNYTKELRSLVKPILYSLEPEDGLITSWGVLLPYIADFMHEESRYVRIGTMAQAQEAGWRGITVVSARYENYRAGVECARLLLKRIQLLEGYKPESVRIILPVEMELIGG